MSGGEGRVELDRSIEGKRTCGKPRLGITTVVSEMDRKLGFGDSEVDMRTYGARLQLDGLLRRQPCSFEEGSRISSVLAMVVAEDEECVGQAPRVRMGVDEVDLHVEFLGVGAGSFPTTLASWPGELRSALAREGRGNTIYNVASFVPRPL